MQPYAARDLWRTVDNALRAVGKDPSHLTTMDTAPLDHFHTGGFAASSSLLELAKPPGGGRILDLGSGIGGASRFLAEATGAVVTSLDFSMQFCSVNNLLTNATGLQGRVAIVAGDGTALPFGPASFDVVWMQQAGMNIKDKAALHGEIARVLRPGGQFVFQEIVAGPNTGDLDLPVPWAAIHEDNHLEPSSSMRERLGLLGLREDAWEDVTASLASVISDRIRDIGSRGPPVLGAHLLSASDPYHIYANMHTNTDSGRIAFVRGVYSVPVSR